MASLAWRSSERRLASSGWHLSSTSCRQVRARSDKSPIFSAVADFFRAAQPDHLRRRVPGGMGYLREGVVDSDVGLRSEKNSSFRLSLENLKNDLGDNGRLTRSRRTLDQE